MITPNAIKYALYSFFTMNILDIGLGGLDISLDSHEKATFSLIIGVIFQLLKILFTREKGLYIKIGKWEIINIKVPTDKEKNAKKR